MAPSLMCVVDRESSEQRTWLLTLIKVKHTIVSPWRGLAFNWLDSWSRVLFSLFVSSRIWVSSGISYFGCSAATGCTL